MNNSCTCGIYPDEQMRYWEVSCSCPQGQGGGVTSGEVETMIDAAVSGKQDTLVSGVSIKKLNGESILGPGNIVITGGGVDAYTKAETDALLETKASTADTASLQSQISDISSDLTNDFYDKTEVDTKLALKSNIADVYNKDAVDSMLATKASTATTDALNNIVTAHVSDASIHVSQTEKSNWNNKLDQSALNGYATQQWVGQQGYLTGFTESDPIFTSSPAYTITDANKSAWNGAATNATQALGQLNGFTITAMSKDAYDNLPSKDAHTIYFLYD